MNIKIEIDTKTFIRFWMVVIGFMLAGAAIWKAKDALIIIALSAFFALALNGPVAKITAILPGSKKNRVGATAVAYTLLVIMIVAFTWFVVPVVADQTAKFAGNLPGMVEDLSSQYSGIEEFVNEHGLQSYVDQAVESLQDSLSEISRNIGGAVFSGINAILTMIFNLFMIFVMTFLMLIEGPSLMKKFWSMYNNEELKKKHRRIANRMHKAISGFVNGQLLIALISGTCGAVAVFLLSLSMDIPSNLAIPIGVIVAIIGLIPMFGATIAGIIAAIILGFNVPAAGIVFAIYFIIYQQIENNIISPLVQAKTNQISALAVTVALAIGIYAFGLLGALISIPAASCVKILFQEYFDKPAKKPITRKA